MIVYLARTSRTCRACGGEVGCMGKDWNKVPPTYRPVDCETGKELERCPHCGEGGRWWEEDDHDHHHR